MKAETKYLISMSILGSGGWGAVFTFLICFNGLFGWTQCAVVFINAALITLVVSLLLRYLFPIDTEQAFSLGGIVMMFVMVFVTDGPIILKQFF